MDLILILTCLFFIVMAVDAIGYDKLVEYCVDYNYTSNKFAHSVGLTP